MPVLGFGTAALHRRNRCCSNRRSWMPLDSVIATSTHLQELSASWLAECGLDKIVLASGISRKTIKVKLKLDYLDLYLIHWPVSSKPGKYKFPIEEDDFLPMDYTAVWSELEECKRLGLAKCIGVSNFSCKKLQHILSIATIPPSVNQVKPTCSLLNIHHLCKSKGIALIAYSVLGSRVAFWGSHKIMESNILKEIAEAKGKTVAQVSMRWAYEEGEETHRISAEIPQCRTVGGEVYISEKGPIKSLDEMWDSEI
ncbi:unnamed protein product [Brassica oleracea]